MYHLEKFTEVKLVKIWIIIRKRLTKLKFDKIIGAIKLLIWVLYETIPKVIEF